MKNVLLAAGLATFGFAAAAVLTSPPAYPANADNPYGNVDHRNDAGNNTGDSRVDGLNAQQLDQNYKGPVTPRAPSGAVVVAPPPPGMAPPPPPTTVR